MAFKQVAFEFPDEDDDNTVIEIEPSSEEPVLAQDKKEEVEVEVEVVDDTPKADRGRTPSEPPEEITDEELQSYSESVQHRIRHAHKGYHDERRAKEAAERERDELTRSMQALLQENERIRTQNVKNQESMLEQAKHTAAAKLKEAEGRYRDAYDSGDADAVVQAQRELNEANWQSRRVAEIEQNALQQKNNAVQQQNIEQQQQPTASQRALAWKQANPWFDTDREMNGAALGYHQKLVESGVVPDSDEYYDRLNGRMRELFPDRFGDQRSGKQGGKVASVTRSKSPKRIKLTQTQVRVAKRLGLTPEQYAKQAAIDMRKTNNG